MPATKRPATRDSLNPVAHNWPSPLTGLRRVPATARQLEQRSHNGHTRFAFNSYARREVEESNCFDGAPPLKMVILGLSINSSCGNGQAATYRGLMRELSVLGHEVLFLEKDVAWYAAKRDLPKPPCGQVALYSTVGELKQRFGRAIRQADLIMVGSNVQEGAVVGEWVTRVAEGVTAFYDIDTPVTMSRLARGQLDYLTEELIARYQIYFSFAGGPFLESIQRRYGARRVLPLYCSVDPELYFPEDRKKRWNLGFMGRYSEDRQPALDELLLTPARNWRKGRFVVAGPEYPTGLRWPANVRRYPHLPPAKHRAFYNSQRFTLNITRADSVEAGYSPGIRLFEAAACGTPIISDDWDGLDTFFEPGREILIAHSAEESLYYLLEMTESEREHLGQRARARVLAKHTARHRARELVSAVHEALARVADVPSNEVACLK